MLFYSIVVRNYYIASHGGVVFLSHRLHGLSFTVVFSAEVFFFIVPHKSRRAQNSFLTNNL